MATELHQLVSHVVPFLKRSESNNRTPAPIMVWPSDPWPSKSDSGQWLLSGLIQYPLGFQAGVDAFWDNSNEESYRTSKHNFAWILELKDMGGDQARQSARLLVASWADKYRASSKNAKATPACNDSLITAKRILNLLLSYDFHGSSATDSYQSLVSLILLRDGLSLSKKLSGSLTNIKGNKDYFYQSCALISVATCLQAHDDWVNIGEKALLEALDIQVLFDGGHVSRNPQRLAEILKACLDLRNVYRLSDRVFPEDVQGAIDRMAQALKFFRYTDKKLAVFHGGQEYCEKTIDLILHQVGQNTKVVKSLPSSGFERLTQGRSTLVMDVGGAPAAPFDSDVHYAPLSFELSHGKDRIVTNCGSHPHHAGWADALRRTAAHSTLVLDNRDVPMRSKMVKSERTDQKSECLLEAMHDGYEVAYGVKHVRRIHMSDKGQTIRGEDSLFFDGDLDGETYPIAIRFHLNPKVRVSLIKNGEAALLRLFSGVGWSFRQKGATLTLEESVSMATSSSMPVKTQQLVLSFDVCEQQSQAKWLFQREG